MPVRQTRPAARRFRPFDFLLRKMPAIIWDFRAICRLTNLQAKAKGGAFHEREPFGRALYLIKFED